MGGFTALRTTSPYPSFCYSCLVCVEKKEGKPSETDSIKFKISSKTPVGKRTAQKDTIIDITSDSQVNSNFPYRWSPASLPFVAKHLYYKQSFMSNIFFFNWRIC